MSMDVEGTGTLPRTSSAPRLFEAGVMLPPLCPLEARFELVVWKLYLDVWDGRLPCTCVSDADDAFGRTAVENLANCGVSALPTVACRRTELDAPGTRQARKVEAIPLCIVAVFVMPRKKALYS